MTMDDKKKPTGNRWVDFASSGPDTIGGRYQRKFWHPVALSRDLKAGKVVPILVMGEKFTLYRGETGAVHVVGFRCAHRAPSFLSVGCGMTAYNACITAGNMTVTENALKDLAKNGRDHLPRPTFRPIRRKSIWVSFTPISARARRPHFRHSRAINKWG